MKINKAIETAYKVLDNQELTQAEALALLDEVHGSDILDLVSLANKVKEKFAPQLMACSIINAKSGVCSQLCSFCAQSGGHQTGINNYDLLSKEEILANAKEVYATGVRSYGIVTSGWGYKEPNPEFHQLLETLDAIHNEMPDLKLCISVGILSDECAKLLAQHHAYRYNMNLQTNPERYAELITTTHSVEDKIQTIKNLQKYGVTNCTGGIIGLGETTLDRVKMAFAIKDLDVEGIPINVLLPIKGTKLEHLAVMSPAEVAKSFAMFRLVNPTKMIKFAAGRETTMKDFQALLMLAGANAIITGGYLTTRGRSVEEDSIMLNQLGDFINKD